MVAKSLAFFSSQFSKRTWLFWFSLSMSFGVIYGLLALQAVFSGEWTVQDDARQHVFWMLRYVDSELFPNDLISNYFQSVAPVGYTSLYHLAAGIGIHPLILNKLLPPLIGIICTYYIFAFCQRIFPVPFACFLSSLIFNQLLWMKDDIISATPRAFVYPLLLAFLYYLSKRSLLPCITTIALLGAFYPQGVFLCTGMLILQLVRREGISLRPSQDLNDYSFCFMGLGVAVVVMLPYALHVSEFAPVITVEQAKQLPEFYPKGRSSFFKDNLYDFYFGGGRSGLFPRSIFTPATTAFGFLLPILYKFRRRFPLLNKIQSDMVILPQLILVSVVMFCLAHAFLFKLLLPSRYTGYSFRIIIALAAGIVVSAILDVLWQQLQTKILGNAIQLKLLGQKFLALICIGVILIPILIYPIFLHTFPVTKYKMGSLPSLYKFLQQQPKDTLVASVIADTDNIPTFAKRSILASREYAIPYHWGYYSRFRQRVVDLIEAQYTTDIDKVKQLIRRYGIDLWIIEDSSFLADYLDNNRWLKHHQPVTQQAIDSLRQGKIPALVAYKDSCSVFRYAQFNVISTKCLLNK